MTPCGKPDLRPPSKLQGASLPRRSIAIDCFTVSFLVPPLIARSPPPPPLPPGPVHVGPIQSPCPVRKIKPVPAVSPVQAGRDWGHGERVFGVQHGGRFRYGAGSVAKVGGGAGFVDRAEMIRCDCYCVICPKRWVVSFEWFGIVGVVPTSRGRVCTAVRFHCITQAPTAVCLPRRHGTRLRVGMLGASSSLFLCLIFFPCNVVPGRPPPPAPLSLSLITSQAYFLALNLLFVFQRRGTPLCRRGLCAGG